MTVRLLLAAAAVAAGSVAQAQYMPYYGYGSGTTVNPFNGTLTQTQAGVNPVTGAPSVVSSGYNPYTGAVGQTVTQYNPYTGTTVRQDQAYNPYTGAGYNFARASNPYLSGGYGANPYIGGYGGNPYLGNAGFGGRPNFYPGVGNIGYTPQVVTPRAYVPSGLKPNISQYNFRR